MVDGTVAEEAAQVLANILAIVEAAEGTIHDIVQCTIYVTDSVYLSEVNGIYDAFFAPVPVLPARTFVRVKDMPFGAHVQMQAIAILGRP